MKTASVSRRQRAYYLRGKNDTETLKEDETDFFFPSSRVEKFQPRPPRPHPTSSVSFSVLFSSSPPTHPQNTTRDTSAPVPAFAFAIGSWLPFLADRLVRAVLPPPLYLMKYRVLGYFSTRITAAVAELGIADALAVGPKTAAQLASELKCDERSLFRLLRGAVQSGLFSAAATGRSAAAASPTTTLFSNNRLSAVLREDHPSSLRHMAIHQGGEMERAWQHLAYSVRTGKPCFERAHAGKALFDWLRERPAEEDNFSKAMTEVNHLSASAVISDYYRRVQPTRIVDVGGAHGAFMATLLRALPATSTPGGGLLFDQPQVVARARKIWASDASLRPLAKRADFCAGSFFDAKTLPDFRDGDVVNMRLILHDWSDADSLKILGNLRSAIGTKRVTLALVEVCVPDGTGDPRWERAHFDLHMLCALAAKERTRAEWRDLLGEAGFKLDRVVSTRGLFSVMEATVQA